MNTCMHESESSDDNPSANFSPTSALVYQQIALGCSEGLTAENEKH